MSGHGTLALSALPLMTLVAGALLGIEALSARRTAGVRLATGGVARASGQQRHSIVARFGRSFSRCAKFRK
jgi:hypothetical protein